MAEKEINFVLTVDESDLVEGLKQAGAGVGKFTQKTQTGLSKTGAAWSSFVGNMAANGISKVMSVATSSVIAFGSHAIEEAAKIETLSTRFETLTGSAEEAAILMNQLTEFAASTPFQLEGIANTSAQLLSFGFTADSVQGRLQRIGDVAAASGSDIKEIGLIYGQVGAAGKLTGERLLQLQERGVPILGALADKMGVTTAAAREMITKGKVDFATFEDAFNSLSDKGGFAFESMIKSSKTFDGVISTLKDNFNLFAGGVGQALLPVLKEVAIAATKFIGSLDKNQVKEFITEGLVKVADSLVDVAENINPIINSFKFLWRIGNTVISSLQTGFWTIETSVAAMANGIAQSISGMINMLPDSLVPEGWKENMDMVSEATSEVMNEMGEKLVESAQETQEILSETLGTFNETVVSEETVQGIVKNIDRVKDKVISANKEMVKSNKNAAVSKLKTEKKLNTQIVKEKTFLKKFEEWTNSERGKNFGSTLNTISTLQKSNSKELATIGKAAAIATATIDGFLGVQKALSSAPPPFNFVLAGLVGVAAATNVSNIMSTPTGFVTGGVVEGGYSGTDANIIAVTRKERVLTQRQNAGFEDLVEVVNQGGITGSDLSAEILIELLDATREGQMIEVNMDGETLSDELHDISERRLA